MFQPGQEICNRKYTILSIMGEGRFGITYRTRNLAHQLVLIKTLNDKSIHGQDFKRLQKALVGEAWKLARCRSPYIVKAEEPFQEDLIWCIPMEYVPGESLENYVSSKVNNRLLEGEALEYINQISQALQEVHQHDLLHLDVRPANVLLRIKDRRTEAVLIDFGLARKLNDPITRVRSKEIIDGFVPPELYSSNGKLDARTDIYSLGATLYFLLTGNVPPMVEDRKERNAQLEFPDTVRYGVKQAVLWAMNLKMEKRPESVQQWQKDGLGVDDQIEKPTLVEPAREPASSIPRSQPEDRFWKVIVPAIAALLAGLGGVAAIWQAIKPTPNPTPSQIINKP